MAPYSCSKVTIVSVSRTTIFPMRATDQSSNLTIAVVGDVHDQWELKDNACLEVLGVDLALFVGDFGNEAVSVVQRVAALELPKAVILGNHDAHYTASPKGRQRCPYDSTKEDRVQQQVDLLAESYVGYTKRDFAKGHLSVVGSRPFSSGGNKWRNEEFYQQRYGVQGFESSTQKILEAVKVTAYPTTIFLGHNGPTGLGDQASAPCGRDWKPQGGDHGDPDLADAIAQTRQLGKHIPLVAFGHLHHRLRYTDDYERTFLAEDEWGTVYLNAACVPRIVKDSERDRHFRKFFLVSLREMKVNHIRLLGVGEDFSIVEEKMVYQVESHPQKLL